MTSQKLFVVNGCVSCPNVTTERTQGAGYAIDYTCRATGTLINGYVEWSSEEPKEGEFPDWCPLDDRAPPSQSDSLLEKEENMSKRLILELTDKEAGEVRSIVSAYLDAGGVTADCGDTPDSRAGNRALNRVIEKIDAARTATPKKVRKRKPKT